MYRFIIIKKRVALLCALLLALTLAGGICFAAAGVVTTQEELPPQEGVHLPGADVSQCAQEYVLGGKVCHFARHV